MFKKWSIGKNPFLPHIFASFSVKKHIMINHEMSFWFMFLPIVLYKNLKVLLVGPWQICKLQILTPENV